MGEVVMPRLGDAMTKLQEAAYHAQLAAGLPISPLAHNALTVVTDTIDLQRCATYIHTVQQTAWFGYAFPGHAGLVAVRGGKGVSNADAARRKIKIGVRDRASVSMCEQACLHELAHIVTADLTLGNEPREPSRGKRSSKGHHHAWRANFIMIVRQMLGSQAANRLRHEFDQWGLPTCR